jgi:archaellum biogenesis ATPase FlaH
MERIPFGINRLDSTIRGGAPEGSVVLLSGEAGAGGKEFMYTTAVMHGLAGQEHDLFDLHYGDLPSEAMLPEEVHFISVTHDERELRSIISTSMDEEIARAGLENVSFESLAKQYFHVSPVPRNWYADQSSDIRTLAGRHEEREGLLSALGGALSERSPGNLVILDSLSDLVGASGKEFSWSDISYLINGLEKAAHSWGALVLVHLNRETVTDIQHGQLVENCDGTLQFQWETGGSTRARTMVVKKFNGVLSKIEAENIVKFETDLGDAGFDISDVRKIR